MTDQGVAAQARSPARTYALLAGSGLALASSLSQARRYALAAGLLYTGLAGFVVGGGRAVLGLVPTSIPDDLLHLAIGAAWIASGGARP